MKTPKPYFHPTNQSEGITLREYFAAAALPALIRSACVPELAMTLTQESKTSGLAVETLIARQAFIFADAMLTHHEQPI